MRLKSAAFIMVILDCCRQDAVITYPVCTNRAAGQTTAINICPISIVGCFAAFACGRQEVAKNNPTERNGLYTKHLLACIRKSPSIDIFDLFNEVHHAVIKDSNSEQRPEYTNSAEYHKKPRLDGSAAE